MAKYRILLVDDSPDFLDALAAFLAPEPELQVVGRSLTGPDAVAQVEVLKPDVVLMDLDMPEMDGLQATRLIKVRPGAPRVIIVTLHDNAEYRAQALAARADGFVVKSELVSELLPLIYAPRG